MEKGKLREYWIIGVDNVTGLEDDINLIATEPLKLLVGTKETTLIATFESELDVDKIKEILNVGGRRSFFISEMNPATFSAHIDNEAIDKYLFEDFNKKQKIFVDIKRNFLDFISTGLTNSTTSVLDVEYNEERLSSLTGAQRSDLIDKLLTNDVDKLTNNQKKVLNFLASL